MDWEDKFRRLRKESEEEKPSFLSTVEAKEVITAQSPSEPIIENPIIENTVVKDSVSTERAEILTGLKDLAEEMHKETGDSIKFPGGEVKLATDPLVSSEALKVDALEDCPELDVLFVHNYSSDALALPMESRAEAPSEQLLQRMIKAMKMPKDSYESLIIEEDKRDSFIDKLATTKVKIVVPMGAIATNLVLGKQERISKIHGKFFSKDLEYQNGQVRSFQVVPVFNSEMILINPNMKRSTWLDLQKIMEKLGIATD